MLTREQILRAEQTRNDQQCKIYKTFADRDKGPDFLQAWKDACLQYHETTVAPDCLWYDEFQDQLKSGDREAVEDSLLFLEVDPWYHRSGYLKELLIDNLKQTPLSEQDKARIRQIIINVASGENRREFRRICRLAAKVNTIEFEAAIERLAKEAGPENHGKLSQLMRYVRKHCPTEHHPDA